MKLGLVMPVCHGAAPDDKYTFESILLDMNGWDYSFDAEEYARIPGAKQDGALQKGKTIAEYFARKNGAPVEACIRKIELLDSDAFSRPMPRAVALERAKRILRKNTPLMIHLKRSMPVMQMVSDAIDERNKVSLSAQMIPTFVKSIAFDILREDENHFWKIFAGGNPVQICRMVSVAFGNGTNAILFEKGFRLKLLFDAFMDATATHAGVQDAVNSIWQPLVDNQAAVQKDYLDFLLWAKEEADTRMSEYFVDGRAMAKRQLFRELHLSDEEYEQSEQMKALYQGVQRVYKGLEELVR